MKEAVTDAQERPGFPLRSELRSFRSLQDGDENRGQLFALLSRRCELFHVESICRNGFYDATLPRGGESNSSQCPDGSRAFESGGLGTRAWILSRCACLN